MSLKSGSAHVCLALCLSGPVLLAQTLAANPDQPVPAAALPAAEPESSVRIVRLSTVRGEVKLDRETGNGLETAFTNLPIVQGARLQTAMGIAEVEFEDNSTLRLAPNTLVEFTHLGLRRSGTKDSVVRVLKGTAFLSRTDSKDHDLAVTFAKDQLTLPPGSHIELKVSDPDTRLTVMNGTVQVEDPTGNLNLAKKKSLLFDSASSTAPKPVAFTTEEGPLAKWDKEAVTYHNVRANAAFGSGYGSSDLNYYGSFANLGGSCGNVWRPYFTSAAWDPFANGVWALYPGAGYSWVSPYPWGWQPFHSGSWQYCGSGAGWGWQPGSNWNGINNVPLVRSSTTSVGHPRPLPPAQHSTSLVVVNTRPLAVSQYSTADKFTFRNDSAGLGVPREAFSHLGKVSAGVAQHGTVTTTVYSAAQSSAQSSAQSNVQQSNQGYSAGNAQTHSLNNSSIGSHSSAMSSQSSHMSSGASPSSSGGGSSKGK